MGIIPNNLHQFLISSFRDLCGQTDGQTYRRSKRAGKNSPPQATRAHWTTSVYCKTTDVGLVHSMVRLLTSQPELVFIYQPRRYGRLS